MFGKLYPSAYAKDVFSIDYKKLYEKGYRGILFDVDNTLVHHNDDATPEVEALFREIFAIGLKTILISDNTTARLERFTKNIDTPFIADANKPQATSFEKALEVLGIEKSEAVVIGDQMFMDIAGANNALMDSIMVHFVVKDAKAKIGIRRYIEKFILFFYNFAKSRHKLDFAISKE